MTVIKSKRHPLKFYTVLIFVFLFLGALGSLFLFASIDLLQKDNPETKNYFLPIFSLAFYFLAFSMVYAYWKNSPKISIDNQTITIGKDRYYLKDIKKVRLTGKMPFRLIIRFPMEGTALIFNDGTEKYFFDDLFLNSWEIKSFLEQTVIKKTEFIPNNIDKVDSDAIRFEQFETFKRQTNYKLKGNLIMGINRVFYIFINFKKSISTSRFYDFFRCIWDILVFV